MICIKTIYLPSFNVHITHKIVIINFVGRQDVTVNNYMRTVRTITHGYIENQHRQAVQNAAISVSSHMLEFNLQQCHELLNVHMIATVSAIVRRYLGGRRGGGSVHVGRYVCTCGRRSTNERKWLLCHPEDNAACRVTTDLTNTYLHM